MQPAVPGTTFLLVRHAQTVWNQEQRHSGSSEVALSPVADQQIAQLTRRLLGEPISALYTSPLSRCVLTVQPTADILGLSPVVCDDLKERSLGTWEGLGPKQLAPAHPGYRFPQSAYNDDFQIPGAEPLKEFEWRIREFLRVASARHPGETVLVSTHSGVIWTMLCRLVAHPLAEPGWPSNCSLHIVRGSARSFALASSEAGLPID